MAPMRNKGTNKEKFFESYKNHTQDELLVELIWNLKRTYHLNEKVRQNTSKLVWWLIAIPFIIGGIIAFMTFAGMASL